MILSTHSVVGAVSAYSLTNNPFIALLVGIVSHFVLDAIPHWDYTLNTNEPNPTIKGFVIDAARVSLDLTLGFLLVLLFVQGINDFNPIIWAGVLGGIIPDIFQFLGRRLPKTPLFLFVKFHDIFHTKKELKAHYLYGVLFQFFVVVLFLFLS